MKGICDAENQTLMRDNIKMNVRKIVFGKTNNRDIAIHKLPNFDARFVPYHQDITKLFPNYTRYFS